MRKLIITPTYFSSILQYAHCFSSSALIFEGEAHYQKQTLRNRCYITSPQGRLRLTVPVQHLKNEKQAFKDVKIDYKENWQLKHLRSLKTSYSNSPFFEFLIDDLQPIFEKRYTYLMEICLAIHQFVLAALQQENHSYSLTKSYEKNLDFKDCRNLAEERPLEKIHFSTYYQPFIDKNDFLPNLSILDLLFMEGSSAYLYLMNLGKKLLENAT